MAGIYEIYIDSLFLTNFLMDMLALYLTGIFLRRQIRLWRLACASALGSVLGIALFLTLPNYLMYELLLHFICNPVMVMLCFGNKTLSAVVKDWLCTYLFMLLTGGIMQWTNQTLFGGRHLYAAIFVTFVLGHIAALLWERKHTLGMQLYHVTLQFKEHEVSVEAYYDTGNLMTDPFCGKPVSIVDGRLIEEILRQENASVRVIPFSSVGKESGLMKAVTIEELRIEDGRRRLCIYDPVIGIAGGSLFAGKTYQMILNCRLLGGQNMPS